MAAKFLCVALFACVQTTLAAAIVVESGHRRAQDIGSQCEALGSSITATLPEGTPDSTCAQVGPSLGPQLNAQLAGSVPAGCNLDSYVAALSSVATCADIATGFTNYCNGLVACINGDAGGDSAPSPSTASPPPSPPRPPAPAPPPQTISLTMTASGSVADYDATKINEVKDAFISIFAGLTVAITVTRDEITITVTAAGRRLEEPATRFTRLTVRQLSEAGVSIAADVEVPGSVNAAATQSSLEASESTIISTMASVAGVTVSAVTVGADSDGDGSNPCFPSSAMVTLSSGRAARIDSLKEGDAIVASAADGTMTTDVVSLLSLARPEAEATFLVLTTDAGQSVTLTPEHHLPVGASCCSTLKQAKDIAVGETVWAVDKDGAAAMAQTVTKTTLTLAHGLHSPVLVNGGFPVVDGVVTSFDDLKGVQINAHLNKYLIPIVKAAGVADLVRSLFFGAGLKYVDGFESQPSTPASASPPASSIKMALGAAVASA